ncbi:Transmembrane 9 superfamily member [Aphelenchoides besseyi]|nr:Transmembrane 9 superfamily member [Aphelenchoides besseyi]
MTRTRRSELFRWIFVLAFLLTVAGDEHDHMYKDNEEVVLWMNTIGPYNNRQETYSYFSLPFCKGTKQTIEHYHETLGEALLGVELEYSGLDIRFKANQEKTEYCRRMMSAADVEALNFAVQHNYWYQMYMDDLPLWALLGETNTSTKASIYTHKRFEIGYNENQIVDVSVVVEQKKPLVAGQEISFTYEVIWKPSNVPFEKRFDKYLDPTFFQHRVCYQFVMRCNIAMYVLDSLVLNFQLIHDGHLSCRPRLDDSSTHTQQGLRSISSRNGFGSSNFFIECVFYNQIQDEEINDDYGWKQVHGDVFRPPQYPLMFCSMIGTGYHLLSVLFITIGLSILAEFYTERGSLLSATIFVYAICAPVNGFFGGSMYSRVGGQNWIKQMVFGAFLFPGFLAWIALMINTIAIYYHASRAIPFTSMLSIFFICAFVILPLNFVGTLLGRNLKGQADIPCRINVVPRPIPDKKWYLEPTAISIIAGFLPFGSIFIEMYFIFTSFWAYKIYYVYGFMLLVAVILIIVTACVTIVATYFLLNAEDYRWRWSSFTAGGSIALYVYMYSIYYYFFKTKMYGLFQTSFYFGYMGIFSVALGILCGTVGYVSSASFVHKIYSRIKLD